MISDQVPHIRTRDGIQFVIIPISEHRLKRVVADIQEVDDDGKSVAIGQIIEDLVGIWTHPAGNVVKDARGILWLERASLDTSTSPDRIPNSYLAASVDSLKQVASLNCEAAKLATLPRSQQYRFTDAVARLRDWVKINDPRCFEDSGSYWNEVWREEDY